MTEFKMPLPLTPEQRILWANWIDALEAGTYHQAEGALQGYARDESEEIGFCCLGVVCDINPDVTWRKPFKSDYTTGDRMVAEYMGHDTEYSMPDVHDTELPYGLKVDMGMPSDFMSMLAQMNDAGTPFKGIAVVLRAAGGFKPQFTMTKAVDELAGQEPTGT